MKRFDATPARRQKARREGNVARSSEIAAIVAFGAAALATGAVLDPIGAAAAAAIIAACATPVPRAAGGALVTLGVLTLVPIAAAGVAAAGAGIAQSGGLTIVMPVPKVSRLNPLTGLKRMFGGEAVVGIVRATLAAALAAFALVPVMHQLLTEATALRTPAAFATAVVDAARRSVFAALAVGAIFACADYALARRRWLRDLRMTAEEVKRDVKEHDGDAHTRSRRKTLHRTLVRGSVQRTRDASFVVVNPTHVAIAIRYAPPTVAVPAILVRAADDAAAAVRRIAAEHRIPVIENVALARALYAHGEAGRAIPSETFVAVAHIIAALAREGALQ